MGRGSACWWRVVMAVAKVSMPPMAVPMRMPARVMLMSFISALPSPRPAASSACARRTATNPDLAS